MMSYHPPSREELKELLSKYYISNAKISRYLGIKPRAWSRFIQAPETNGFSVIPMNMYHLLRIGAGLQKPEPLTDHLKIPEGVDLESLCAGPWENTFSSGEYSPPTKETLIMWMDKMDLSRALLAEAMGTPKSKVAGHLAPDDAPNKKILHYSVVRMFLLRLGVVEPEELPKENQ